MGLFDFFGGSASDDIEIVNWVKSENGQFHRLAKLDTNAIETAQAPTLYIIWHGGKKPSWVYMGVSHDLPSDLKDIRHNKDIMQYQTEGSLLVTWSLFRKDEIPGVFSFLNDILMPDVISPDAELYRDEEPIRILPPGYDVETFVKAFERERD